MYPGLERCCRALYRRLFAAAIPPVIHAVRDKSLTYLDERALLDLYELVTSLERRRVAGMLIEAGCALGGSAIVLAAAKSRLRPLNVYDVFSMIPAPSERDGSDVHARYRQIIAGQSSGIDGGQYYGYVENLYDVVVGNFRELGFAVEEHSVRLIKGLFQETLCIEEPVAAAHIDGDWYDSVMTCLVRITPHLVQGGVIVIDDYDAWSGCRAAVDAYFSDKRDAFEFVPRSRLHIVRKQV